MSNTEPRTIVKKVDHAILYSDGTILVQHVRASYPHIFSPYEGENDAGKKTASYGVVGLMPKGAEYRAAKDLIRDRINELMRENKVDALKSDRKFLRDGDQEAKAECVGMFVVSARESRRPAARSNRRDPKTKKPIVLQPDKDDDVFYGGCWINMLIRPWYQNHKQYGKRVNAGLVAVQSVPLSIIQKFLPDAVDDSFGEGRISEDAVNETFDEDIDDDASGFDDGDSLGDDDIDI